MKKVFLYFLSYVIIQLLVTIPFQVVANTQDRALNATEIILSSTISNIIAVAVFALKKWHPTSFRDSMEPWFHPSTKSTNPWVVLYWTTIISLGLIIPSQFLEELIPEALRQDVAADIFKSALSSPWSFIALAIMAPIAEETVFRGAIMRAAEHTWIGSLGISSNGVCWGSVLFTSLLFAAVHGNPAQMPHAFLIGMLLGWLAYRSGSIIPGILLHFINNGLAFALYQLYPQSYDMHIIDFFDGSNLRLAGAIALSLAMFLPSIYQLNAYLNKRR